METSYEENPLTWKEQIRILAACEAGALLLAYLFYEHWIAGLCLSFLTPLGLYRETIRRKKERRNQLAADFSDALEAMTAALQAGYSPENALVLAADQMEVLHGRERDITREFQGMKNRLKLGVPLEKLLWEMGERSGIEDIQNFAAVYHIAGRSGGSLVKILRRTSDMLREKKEVQQEIRAGLAARKMEQQIMSLMPAGILLYLKISSPGFLSVMYQNFPGIVLMTLCLLGYGGAWYLGERILQSEEMGC